MYKILDLAHDFLKKNLKSTDIAVDFTAGNGHDTLFLAKICKDSFVLAFDVQEKAIINTKMILKDNDIKNVKLILDGHENCDNYINFEIGGGIFNFGYLPNSDKNIKTKVSTDLIALKKAIDFLKINGVLSLTVYTGHKEGELEAREIEKFLKHLCFKKFDIATFKLLNKQNAPYNIFIKKRI